MADENDDKQTTITIPKNDRYDGRVPVSVNGQVSHISIDTPTAVGEHILEALNNAGVEYFESEPKGTEDASGSGVGSEASKTVERTATRVEPNIDENAGTGDAPPTDAPPVLGFEEPATVPANTSTSTDADVHPDGEGQAEPGPLDSNLTDLKAYLAKSEDAAEIDQLLAAEKAGKSRAGAITALEARKAELAAA